MAKVPATIDRDGIPWCSKCDRQVDHFEWERGFRQAWPPAEGSVRHVPDGTMTILVTCHGETIRMSRASNGRWAVEEASEAHESKTPDPDFRQNG